MSEKTNPNRPYPGVFRKGTSKNWVIDYYRADGKRVKESTKTDNLTKARAMLRERQGAKDRGEIVERGVRVSELYDDLYVFVKSEASTRGKRSLQELGWRWAHLKPVFGHLKAAHVTNRMVVAYKVARQGAGAAEATIHRELATLRRMFNYAKDETNRVKVVPSIKLPKEKNARQGFVEDAQFDRLAAEASGWLRTFLELAYSYGWRRSELLGLRVRHVDMRNRTIRLDPGTTKNGEGREVSMTLKVEELLRSAIDGKRKDDFVLTRDNGKPIADFRGAWDRLCEAAGVPGLLVHDLRRSAAKAMRRAGVPESVIMDTGGWKTAEVFRRYAIISGSDQREAITLLEAARERNRAASNGTVTGPFSNEAGEQGAAKVN